MPEFNYTAYNGAGELVRGSLHAASKDEVVSSLANQSLFVDNVSSKLFSFSRKADVTDKEFLGFNKQLTSLIKAGMPLVESLSIARKRGDNKGFASVLESIEADLRNGASFADSCENHPGIFDEIFRSNIRTAERSGNLYQALCEYQAYLSRKIEFQSTLKKAIAYPIFLIVTLVIVLGFLFVFIVPSFSELFQSFNAELPLATRVVMRAADFFPYIAGTIILLAVTTTLSLKAIEGNVAAQQQIDRVKLKLPVIGLIVEQNRSAQVARNVSTMLVAGMPLVGSLENLEGTFRKTSIGPKLKAIRENVMDGVPFYKAMQAEALMTEQAIRLVEAGESAGDLGAMLSEVADYYEGELSERLSVIMSLFEPVLMLLIGFVVGGIIVSMYLPIFYLAEVVK